MFSNFTYQVCNADIHTFVIANIFIHILLPYIDTAYEIVKKGRVMFFHRIFTSECTVFPWIVIYIWKKNIIVKIEKSKRDGEQIHPNVKIKHVVPYPQSD